MAAGRRLPAWIPGTGILWWACWPVFAV